MYASAMKYCGAMEVCGVGFPRGSPMADVWPEVLEQARAQRAGMLVVFVRGTEGDFFLSVGFRHVAKVTNPRTGNPATLMIKVLDPNQEVGPNV